MPERLKLPRRRFLGLSALTAVFIGLGLINKSGREPDWQLDFNTLTPEAILPPLLPLPKEFTGVSINAPFYWDYPDLWDADIPKMAKSGIKLVRIFIDHWPPEADYEPKLGEYRPEVLDKIRNLACKLAECGINLEVDLFNGYRMRRNPNINLGDNKYISCYNPNQVDPDTGYSDMYSNPVLRIYFNERIRSIVCALSDVKNIIAWGFNELDPPPAGNEKAAEDYNQWYIDTIRQIRKYDKDRYIITGCKKPWDIDEELIMRATGDKKLINTIHIYDDFSFKMLREYYHSSKRSMPMWLQETGASGFYLIRNSDDQLAFTLPSIFVDIYLLGLMKKYLTITSALSAGKWRVENAIGLWKWPGHKDNFSYPWDPATHPLSADFLSRFNRIINCAY